MRSVQSGGQKACCGQSVPLVSRRWEGGGGVGGGGGGIKMSGDEEM